MFISYNGKLGIFRQYSAYLSLTFLICSFIVFDLFVDSPISSAPSENCQSQDEEATLKHYDAERVGDVLTTPGNGYKQDRRQLESRDQ
jgi:hypothetical protein